MLISKMNRPRLRLPRGVYAEQSEVLAMTLRLTVFAQDWLAQDKLSGDDKDKIAAVTFGSLAMTEKMDYRQSGDKPCQARNDRGDEAFELIGRGD